jgi:hypothetical protein
MTWGSTRTDNRSHQWGESRRSGEGTNESHGGVLEDSLEDGGGYEGGLVACSKEESDEGVHDHLSELLVEAKQGEHALH